MKRMKHIALVLCIFALLISGCALSFIAEPPGRYYIEINSIAAPQADMKNKTYVIVSAMKSVNTNDIQFKEFARYVEVALSKTEYKRVSGKDANLIIRLAYGIGKPKTEVSTRTYNTSGGYSYPIGFTWIHVPPTTKTVRTETTTYDRFLILEAYDPKDMKSQLWRTIVESEGTTSDLRIALPHMIAAATYRFGTDTKGKLDTKIYINSPQVLDTRRSSYTAIYSLAVKEERLGVTLENLTSDDQLYEYNLYNKKMGILVVEVGENGVAQKMGIEKYDIIIAANNTPIYKVSNLLEEIRNTRPGKIIRITFFDWDSNLSMSETDYLK